VNQWRDRSGIDTGVLSYWNRFKQPWLMKEMEDRLTLKNQNAIQMTYPTLSQLLAGSVFDSDADLAIELGRSPKGSDDLREALEAGLFKLSELMWLLCGAVDPEFADSSGSDLENNLASIVTVVGLEVARSSYRGKLLVNKRDTLEDVRYEIAVTARACSVLDAGSIELEKPIPDDRKERRHWKNSDIFGTYQNQPVRIEVTVLHENLPPAIHMELDDLVRQAEIASGFRITLRSVIVDKGYAERVRALIELLHECHVASRGKTEEIDGVHFEWVKGAYKCRQESPFESICFYGAEEFSGAEKLRELIHPCSVRSVTPKYILEDNPNPPGVITFADLPDAPTQVPVSTKIHQMLNGKLQQCEEGVINIVAFGNPLPMHDREVVSAVSGPEVVLVPLAKDRSGAQFSGKGLLRRNAKAPFAPAEYLASDEDRATFVEPFKRMSAVWHIRLGGYAKSGVIPNPNALLPAPRHLIAALSDPVPLVVTGTTGSTLSQDSSESESQPEPTEIEDAEIIWTEMAGNYVLAFDSLEEANAELTNVTSAGHSFDELQRKVEQLWSEPTSRDKETKFISLTNEELAMTFVVDCGGYEQAKACLEAYFGEIEGEASQK
jgi:hypothetical protein